MLNMFTLGVDKLELLLRNKVVALHCVVALLPGAYQLLCLRKMLRL